MNHKEKLVEVYQMSFDVSDIDNIPKKVIKHLENISGNIDRNKGVYTVLITLLVHKILYPKQDIRFFQEKMKDGFSARTIDTKFITPTLKELGLASMAESGWLTRSLEQPYPYTLDYKGEISGSGMKEAFLKVIDVFQKNSRISESILRYILNKAILLREKNKIKINKLSEGDDVFISTIVSVLEKHFQEEYKTHGGSKLPVLAFYAMYKYLILEIGRYKGCTLAPLGSHTTSDRTSKSAGDIQVIRKGKVFEAVEIKLGKGIDVNMARIAYEKIAKFNTERYYILSSIGVCEQDKYSIEELIIKIKEEHGCQLIINGLLYTLKYYLRLISDTRGFFNDYIELVKDDTELKVVHKVKLNEIIKEFNI